MVVEFVGGGGRSRRGARCLRPRGWRRWLAGQHGPAGRRQPHGNGVTPGRGRYTLVVAGRRGPHSTGVAPGFWGSMTHADPNPAAAGCWRPEPLAARRADGLHWPPRPAAEEWT